jgi:hypothetical protein
MPRRQSPLLPRDRRLSKLPDWKRRPSITSHVGDDPAEIVSRDPYRILIAAIDNHQTIRARYGDDEEWREFCPTRIGLSTHGRYMVEAYQVAGFSKSGIDESPWRCFHLADLHDVSPGTAPWFVGDPGSGESSCLGEVLYPVPLGAHG